MEMQEEFLVRPMIQNDWMHISSLLKKEVDFYQEGEWEAQGKFMIETGKVVGEIAGEIIGYACLFPLSSNPKWQNFASPHYYVSKEYSGNGFETKLLNYLIAENGSGDKLTLQSDVSADDLTTIDICQSLGFTLIKRSPGLYNDNLLFELVVV